MWLGIIIGIFATSIVLYFIWNIEFLGIYAIEFSIFMILTLLAFIAACFFPELSFITTLFTGVVAALAIYMGAKYGAEFQAKKQYEIQKKLEAEKLLFRCYSRMSQLNLLINISIKSFDRPLITLNKEKTKAIEVPINEYNISYNVFNGIIGPSIREDIFLLSILSLDEKEFLLDFYIKIEQSIAASTFERELKEKRNSTTMVEMFNVFNIMNYLYHDDQERAEGWGNAIWIDIEKSSYFKNFVLIEKPVMKFQEIIKRVDLELKKSS